MNSPDLPLRSLFSFEPEAGRVRLGDGRMVVLQAEALGVLRAQLVDTLGLELASGLLFRFGYESGRADADRVRAAFDWEGEGDLLSAGTRLHAAAGWARVEVRQSEVDPATDRLRIEGAWIDSFEAEQHLARYGPADTPACFSLAGYASGWASAATGRRLVAVETACVAQGAPECRWVIEPAAALGEAGARWVAALGGEAASAGLSDRIAETQRELEDRNAELTRANEELADLYRSRTDFLAEVSHELRTPLSLILAPLEELLGLPPETSCEAARDRIQLVHRNAMRLLRLVNSVLDLTRAAATGARLRPKALDLAAFLEELVGTFRPAFEARGTAIALEAEAEMPPFVADPDALEKVFTNLLANALKYTPPGGRVALSARREAGMRLVAVRDSGPGIPAEELSTVFERFRQSDPQRDGYGLGLALVREQVRLLGGNVTVESREGAGTVFRVRLPEAGLPVVSEPDPWEVIYEDEPGLPSPTSEGAGRPRILVAEDDGSLASYLESLLARDWTVERAADGVEALEKIAREPPELVLSDVMMPRLDGLELVGRLKADPETRDIPVMLLTARGELENRLRGFSSGADDYLVKPFAGRELLARARVHLELHRARTALKRHADRLERLVEEQVGHILDQNRRLERANRELEDFLTIVSHDLKSPLVSIAGFAQLLEDAVGAGQLDPSVGAALQRIRFNADWMQSLIDRLLSLAEVRAGTSRARTVDLDMLLRQLSVHLGPVVEDVGGHLEVSPELGRAVADPDRLTEAVSNVIENAVKYRHPDRPLRVGVSSHVDEAGVDLRIEDNGIGLAPEHHEKVFLPLFRVPGEKTDGSGLGLYIVRRIVEEVGGSVWIGGEVGVGTVVHLRLPYEAQPEHQTDVA